MAAKSTKKLFVWTEEETALLLKVVLDYKTVKFAAGQDWETVRSNYEDLAKRLAEAYPNEVTEEFPRGERKEDFTAAKIASKMKKMKNGFRKALDSGKKSGGGRIVSSLYQECADVWAGCPAATSIDGGLETTDLNKTEDETLSEENSAVDIDSQESSLSISTENNVDDDDGLNDESKSSSCEPLKKKMKLRREELSNLLKDRRNSKSIKKTTFQEKMLNFATEESDMRKEDLELKKRLVDQFESSEKQFSATIQKLSEDLNKTMSEGFHMMQMMLQPMQVLYPAQSYYQMQRNENQWQNMTYEQNTNRSEDSSELNYANL